MPPRSTKNMPPGLRAYWRKKNAARRARSAPSRSPRRASPTRRGPKRSTMPKKTRRPTQTRSALKTAAGINAGVQVLEPVLSRANHIIAAAKRGDGKTVAHHAGQAMKETLSFENVGQAAGPAIAVGALAKLASAVGIKSPRMGKKWRLW